MLNRIILMGRLTKDPELRRTGSGIAVCSFTIAVDRDYTGKDNSEKVTDFFDIVAWRSTGEFVAKYFAKGRMAVIDGRLEQRRYTDKDGNKRISYEVNADSVYFGDSKKSDGNGNGNNQNYGGNNGGQNYGGGQNYDQGYNNGGFPQNGGSQYGSEGGNPYNPNGGNFVDQSQPYQGGFGYPIPQGGYDDSNRFG